MGIHKLSWFYKGNRKTMAMLCRASKTGTNSDPKTVNWDYVTCFRCLACKKNEKYITVLD